MDSSTNNRLLRTVAMLLILSLAIFNYINRAVLVPNARYILMDLYGYSMETANQNMSKVTTLHTIFKWTAAAFTILYGYLNDKFPRKMILTVGAITYGICSIITAYVQSYEQLVAMQIITAISIGASLPTSYSILSDMYPVKNRGRVFGVFGLAAIFGDILGSVLISMIYPATEINPTNWRPPFLITGALSLILAIAIFFLVMEPKRGGMDNSLREVLTNESIEYSSRINKGDLKEVWTNKTNRWLIMNFIDNIVGGYILATAIDWLRYEHGADPEVAGMLILIPALAIIGGTLFWGAIGDKWFEKDKAGRVIICTICLAMSAIFLPIAVSRPFDLTGLDLGGALADSQFVLAFAMFFIFFFFNHGVGPGWHATLIDANRVEVRGSMLSVATFFEEFGEGLGILIGGLIYEALVLSGVANPFGTTYLYLTIFMALGVLMWIPLIKNVRLDIAAVDEWNKKQAAALSQ